MALVTINRKHGRSRYVLRCDCCGCLSRPAATEYLAARWAHIGRWDTPGPEADDDCCEWWFRCPKCVKRGRWPLETQGWFGVLIGPLAGMTPDYCMAVDGQGGGPTIRLADGDEATTLGVEEMPEALIAEA